MQENNKSPGSEMPILRGWETRLGEHACH